MGDKLTQVAMGAEQMKCNLNFSNQSTDFKVGFYKCDTLKTQVKAQAQCGTDKQHK